LARALFVRGVRVLKIEVVPDNLVLISQWIRDRHDQSDFVFVCGGIGGTPDDVTRQAVALGLGVALERNKKADAILKKYYGDRLNESRLAMADLPAGAELIDNPVTHAPGIKIKNVYVFAGVPKILHAMFEAVQKDFVGKPILEEELNLKVGEGEITVFMKELNKEFPLLELGSYPTLDPAKGYKTQLVFKSTDRDLIAQAVKRFREMCDPAHII
jgi:molybdopterin-biosynthesis enzyme MoeA-like protein